MAYQFFNPAPVFFDLLGIDPAAGGSLTFYEIGTTTEKDTYSDRDLSIPNANPVQLDSAARSNTQIWLDGEYSVVLKDGDGATVWTRDMTSGQDAGASIPALVNGQFLTNNGTDTLWAAIRQVPDPTGSANRILSTDGSNLLWIPQQEIPDPATPDIVVTDESFQAGTSDNESKKFELSGTGTATATNQLTTSASITFAPGFDALDAVLITPTTTGCTSNSPPALPSWSVSGWTPGSPSSGVTVNFYVCPVQTISSEDMISSSISFAWVAFGRRTVAAP